MRIQAHQNCRILICLIKRIEDTMVRKESVACVPIFHSVSPAREPFEGNEGPEEPEECEEVSYVPCSQRMLGKKLQTELKDPLRLSW